MAEQVNQLNMDDPEKANKIFLKLFGKARKSKEDLIAVGTYFLEQNNYPAASMCAKEAEKLAPTNIDVLKFVGEVNIKAQKWGEAGQKYDLILSLEPDNLIALKRNAFIYKNVNPLAAVDYLNKIKELDPSYADADAELGDIYYNLKDYGKANEYYAAYYSAVQDKSKLDVVACRNYIRSLFSMQSQDETALDKIVEVVPSIRPLAPKDIVIPRMDFFAKVTKIGTAIDYEGALRAADEASAYIKNKEFADTMYMYLDYDFAAKLVAEQGSLEDAIKYYTLESTDLQSRVDAPADAEEAKQKDEYVSRRATCYYEISTLYVRLDQAEKGIEAYQKYLDIKGDKVDARDKYTLGTKYLAASQQDSISADQKKMFADKAAEVYNEVITTPSDNPLLKVNAYRDLARLSNINSGEPNDVVRDYYIKSLDAAEAITDEKIKARSSSARFEACRYLFFYYVVIPNPSKAEATKYATIAKEISPDNSFVKDAFEHLKTM